MKKIISLLLALVICLSLCACGKSQAVRAVEEAIQAIGEVSTDSKNAIENADNLYNALSSKEKDQVENYNILEQAQKVYVFELSKTAYNKICKAYEMTDAFASDTYEGWRVGATEQKALLSADNCAEYLTRKMKLTEEELRDGIAYRLISTHATIDGVRIEYNWESATEDNKAYLRSLDSAFLKSYQRKSNTNVFVGVLYAVNCAYIAKGDTEKTKALLEEAKVLMRELSEEYSDYEHYPNLKGFYTTTDSFFEYCMRPEGSFNQAKTTIRDYRDTIRDYQSDLNFIFGE